MEKLQVALNKSLARSLHVYGYTTALFADMGVPPLRLTQQIHLARLPIVSRSARGHTDVCVCVCVCVCARARALSLSSLSLARALSLCVSVILPPD